MKAKIGWVIDQRKLNEQIIVDKSPKFIGNTNELDLKLAIHRILFSDQDRKKLYFLNLEKSHIFEECVEYLSFVVSSKGKIICSSKMDAIRNCTNPLMPFNSKQFLELANNFRCFIKYFASIAKTFADIRKGENGKISTNPVIIPYPDFKKPFDLTADAASFGLRAVLSKV